MLYFMYACVCMYVDGVFFVFFLTLIKILVVEESSFLKDGALLKLQASFLQ